MKFQAFAWRSPLRWERREFFKEKTAQGWRLAGFLPDQEILVVQGPPCYPSLVTGYLLLASLSRIAGIRAQAMEILLEHLATYQVRICQVDAAGRFSLPDCAWYTTLLLGRDTKGTKPCAG